MKNISYYNNSIIGGYYDIILEEKRYSMRMAPYKI